jgi:hypothetical protein
VHRKFLGFSFTNRKEPKRRIAPQALTRFKARVRELTRRTRGASLAQIIEGLSRYLIGWRGYFGFCETPSVLRALDEWIRRRLRAIAWKQWKRGRTRFAELRQRGVGHDLAAQTAGSSHGPWRLSKQPSPQHCPIENLPQRSWTGFPCTRQNHLIRRTAVCGPACTVVWEGRSCEAPTYPDFALTSGLRAAGT